MAAVSPRKAMAMGTTADCCVGKKDRSAKGKYKSGGMVEKTAKMKCGGMHKGKK